MKVRTISLCLYYKGLGNKYINVFIWMSLLLSRHKPFTKLVVIQ